MEAGDPVEVGDVVEAGDAVEAGDVVEAGDWQCGGGCLVVDVAGSQSAALFTPVDTALRSAC